MQQKPDLSKLSYDQLIRRVNRYLSEANKIKELRPNIPEYNPDALVVCVEGNRAYFNVSDK